MTFLHPEPFTFRSQRPFSVISDHDMSAAGQGRLKALHKKERELYLLPKGAGRLPVNPDATLTPETGDYFTQFRGRDSLIGGGHTICDAKEPDPCIRMGNTVADQGNLLTRRVSGHSQKLKPIADRAQRADKIMADARADQRANIGGIMGHGLSNRLWGRR